MVSNTKLCSSAVATTLQHMMCQSTTVIALVAALLIKTLSYCSAENVYCVTPTATLCSSCPHNNHCASLSEYAQDAKPYFISDTAMVFLPGDHVLDTNITVIPHAATLVVQYNKCGHQYLHTTCTINRVLV